MKGYSTLLCMLFSIAVSLFTTAKAQVNVNDSLALVDLYKSTNGAAWVNHTNWLTKSPVSTWYGITVTGTRVTFLFLGNNNLTGTIPSSIGNLVKLELLYLDWNHLKGSIPSNIGKLKNLNTLLLEGNQLSGSIPYSIGHLTNLQYLLLDINQLSGKIPPTIGKLVNLISLALYNNKLSGRIPFTIGNLRKLQNLSLDINDLSSSIPFSIGNLVKLTYLDIGDNHLSGSIPSSIGNLVNLRNLYLRNNQLSGEMPSSIGELVNVTDLDLSYNQLVGDLPASLRISGIDNINLSHNQLRQSKNIDYMLPAIYFPQSLILSYNHFTFNGLEYIANNYSQPKYAPQASIQIHQHGNKLSVDAGGTLKNNTYKWFMVGSTDNTTVSGDSTFQPTKSGRYYAHVTNAIATELTLYTDTIDYKVYSERESNNIITAKLIQPANIVKQMQVFPNPARSTVNVQLNGTATIVLTNEDGKVMLTKTFTNNAIINVDRFAPGIYYLQNKTSGEVKQVVVVH